MTKIELNHIKKSYGETVIMGDMNFTVNSGERLVLLGPSGCGKSTILRMIAGLEEITAGELAFNENVVNEIESGDRNVSMVFQNYALYPHMTVEENITYGLRVNKVPEERIEERLSEVVKVLELEKYLDRKPSELSGGQRQRVALARATVKDSDVFLLDEPLSNLDAQLRVSARESLMDIHQRYGQTMVYVTHDQIEAMTFGDRIALLNFGELQQIDTPDNIYRKPANIFTAQFIGNPPMNVLESSSYKNGEIKIGQQSIKVYSNWENYLDGIDSNALKAGIRPEAIRVSSEPKENTLKGTVSYIENLGANYAMFIDVDGETIVAVTRFRVAQKGASVYLNLINDHLHFFDEETTHNVGYPANILEKIKANEEGTSALKELIARDDARQETEI
jgi:sn-glycerol 3-phosphate transport system ATP-binding protein